MAADATRRDQVEDQADDIVRQAPAHLTPFRKGDPRAAEAGRKGGEARRARRTASVASARAVGKALAEVRATFDRRELGPDAAAAGGWLLGQIVAGRIPIRNGDEAATLLRALVDVARIEAGEATDTRVVAHVGADAMREVLALRDQARAALGKVTDADASEVLDSERPPPL